MEAASVVGLEAGCRRPVWQSGSWRPCRRSGWRPGGRRSRSTQPPFNTSFLDGRHFITFRGSSPHCTLICPSFRHFYGPVNRYSHKHRLSLSFSLPHSFTYRCCHGPTAVFRSLRREHGPGHGPKRRRPHRRTSTVTSRRAALRRLTSTTRSGSGPRPPRPPQR